ncbi:carbohydrate ABC transporter permease [Motilibacter aurantiacus]|uniref:carbohydrate ABC transporter permease n=1 Tax=Motilibacter aurantiacus TaxID=2714955 RepID=UPI001E43F8C8|nr:carbohydrate ABC transporter permease [Motilibacter aurantiacus]
MSVAEPGLRPTVAEAGLSTADSPRRRRPSRGTGIHRRPNPWLMLLGAVVVVTVFVLPYAIMFIGSLKSQADITRIPPPYIGDAVHFDNYRTMWSSSVHPGDGLTATVVISVVATAVVLLVATPAAWFTARYTFPGRTVFLALVLVVQMLQPTVLAVGLFREFLQLGLNDTWIAMILVNSAFNLTFAVWIMQAFFASIPREVDEAAALDGASKLQILTRVSLPLVWPGIVTALIYVFVAAWNEYAAASIIMTSNDLQPLTVALPRFFGLYAAQWHYIFGVSLVAIVPVVVLFALIEKRLAGGLTAGSVK